ncbi:MAG: hypothetical protein ACOH18_00465 [Candidatus Saccharimonadaceae bacterium]
MRRIFFVAILSLLSIGVLASINGASAKAEDLTPEQVQQIKANCVSIKNSLNQLHASDALLRVNRGQVYESVASRLMDNFNSRLGINSLDNKAMTTVTTNYRSELNNFRSDYIAYEQKLSAALRVDCVSQPNSFYDTVQEARKLRATVNSDVLKLHRLIDDYRSSVGDFLLNYERLSQ